MRSLWQQILKRIDDDGRVALITIVASQGSTPREAGARMLVTPHGQICGTIGGGTLEYRLIDEARVAIRSDRWRAKSEGIPLGPDLGQCCGGHLTYLIETFDLIDRPHVAGLAEREAISTFQCEGRMGSNPHIERRVLDRSSTGEPIEFEEGVVREIFSDSRTPVLLFGAGHVGRALTLALAPLPFRIRWIDSRDNAFPQLLPQNVSAVYSADMESEISNAPAQSFLLVMTHSHPLDLAIVSSALKRGDLPFIGLIGSETKKIRFMRRLEAIGLGSAARARLVTPIGLREIAGKEPAIIAASIAADLLIRREALALKLKHETRTHRPKSYFENKDQPHE